MRVYLSLLYVLWDGEGVGKGGEGDLQRPPLSLLLGGGGRGGRKYNDVSGAGVMAYVQCGV